jgi:hypothetical protein
VFVAFQILAAWKQPFCLRQFESSQQRLLTNEVFCDVTLCWLSSRRCFGRCYCLHLHALAVQEENA